MPIQSTVSPAETVRNHPDTEIVAKMDPALKAKWIVALRSGEFKQGKTFLRDTRRDTYCCLGVLCAVSGVAVKHLDDRCTTDTPGINSGLDDRTRSYLGDRLNDKEGKSFAEIADYIEQNL